MGEPGVSAEAERAEADGPSAFAVPLHEPTSPAVAVDPERMGRSRASVLSFPFAAITLILTYWTVDIVSPALPALRDDLALSGAGAGLVFSLFFGGRLLGNLPGAYLVDRVGAAGAVLVGAGLVLVGSILASIANGELLLLPARLLQGIGVALLVTAAMLSMLRARPGDGAAMTAFSVAATVGGVFGLTSGGLLTGTISWRAVFVLSAGLAVVLGILSQFTRRSSPSSRVERSTRSEDDVRSSETVTTSRTMVAGLLANFLVYANYAVFIVSMPLYADEEFDASAERISTLLLAITAVHLVAALPVGRAIRRWGSTRALVAGLWASTAGMALVLVAPSDLWLLLPMVLYGIGQVAGSNAAGDFLLQRGGRGGRAVGMVRFSSDVGLVVGPYAVGALADVLGYSAPFVALPIITAVAALVTLRATITNRR